MEPLDDRPGGVGAAVVDDENAVAESGGMLQGLGNDVLFVFDEADAIEPIVFVVCHCDSS